jgi:Kef-type K+ transport system membrane component KefB
VEWSQIQQSPAFGVMVVALIVVFGPLVAEKLRIPGLIGLLLGGALIGPNILGVLSNYDTLEAAGSIGVLYLIFLAGLQLDIESFMKHRAISVGFGLSTAFVPLALGTMAAIWLGIDTLPAILIGSFWASFTLITYPAVSRYGLTRNRAVAGIVGASAITDTISLVVLALVIGLETGDTSGARLLIDIAVGLGVLLAWCFVVIPRLGRLFFTGLGQERTLRYMFLLIALTSSAVIAELVGIEALLGAFFVGVGLNRIVPNASPLMTVTDFFGNAFFIPTFLVSVGLLFDPSVMFASETLRLALGFALALVIGKLIAAWITGRQFSLMTSEIGLMFSMSVAQAAATLAATVIGLEAGLYGDDVVNAVMVVVAVSLVLTSIGTGRYAPQIPPPVVDRRRVGEAMLLPVAGPDQERLVETARLAARLTEPVSGVVQPLVVATTTRPDEISKAKTAQAGANDVFSRVGLEVETKFRASMSVAGGINRAAIEEDSSMLLITWPGPETVRSYLFGASYSDIMAATSIPVTIAALQADLDFETANVYLFAREDDLLPGYQPSLVVAADIATTLGRSQSLGVGPLPVERLRDLEITLPRGAKTIAGTDDLAAWAEVHTEPGDIIVFPFRRTAIRRPAVSLHKAGRSILAVTHNPESQSPLGGPTMTLPIGGSATPR